MAKNTKDAPVVWSKASHSIFERFAIELKEFIGSKELPGGGTLPSYGDQDVKYCLELQQKRLEDKNIRMEYDFVPNGHFAAASGVNKSWSDKRYRNQMECRTCQFIKSFYREDKRLFRKKENTNFYQIVTFAQNQTAVGEELYTCPNCGAVSKVKELQEGCAYCGTFFKMSDLFPTVSNFFFLRAFGGTEKEVKRSVLKTMLPFMVVAAPCFMVYYYFNNLDMAGSIIPCIISGAFGGVILGGIVGYLAWCGKQLGGLFKEAAKSTPMLINTAGSSKKFVSQMQQYTPEFSFEYFAAKVVSLLKMIVYAEDAQELPNYAGGPVGDLFSDIVEASYSGAVALKEFWVKDGNAYVTVDVYMEDIYEKNGRVFEENDTFRMQLRKNITKPVDFNFSIKKIQCKSCYSSFDATKQKTCPSCGVEYLVGDDDWVVMEIRKR